MESVPTYVITAVRDSCYQMSSKSICANAKRMVQLKAALLLAHKVQDQKELHPTILNLLRQCLQTIITISSSITRANNRLLSYLSNNPLQISVCRMAFQIKIQIQLWGWLLEEEVVQIYQVQISSLQGILLEGDRHREVGA